MTTKDANLSNLTLQASAASVKEGAVAKLTVIGEPNSVIRNHPVITVLQQY